MRRLPIVLFTVLILLTTFVTVAFAGTLKVGPNQQFSEIQEAINAAHDYDMIAIEPGKYRSNNQITINGRHGLIIEGASRDKVQILLTDPEQPVFRIENSTGIRIANIGARHDPPVKHMNCNGAVIWIIDTEYATISNCELNGCGSIGILSGNNLKLTIIDNYIHHNRDVGLSLSDTTGLVKGNIIVDNRTSVSLWGDSSKLVFKNNKL